MPEEQQVAEQKVETPDPFSGSAWSEAQPEIKVAEQKTEEKKTETVTATKQDDPPKVEKTVPIEWLKTEFGVEDPAILKQEREEYKKLKDTKPEELKFVNDESRKLHEAILAGNKKEVTKILAEQQRLEELTSADVTEKNAADIVKAAIKNKYTGFEDADVERKFNKQFGIPKEPVQGDELDEDFKIIHDAWKEKVQDIKGDLILEAKIAKPELEKLKKELVLPETSKKAEQPNQELLAEQAKRLRDIYINTLESDYSKFDGFTTKVKDESVEMPVSFKIPDEDKVAVKKMLENFDPYDYVDKRWFDKDGKPKVEVIMADIYELENREKILSGIANNSASQRLSEYRKQTSNIDVNGKTHQQTFTPEDKKTSVSPFSEGSWSEKPPAFN